MPKRVALYCRVSTDGQTVENQTRELRAVAKRHDWKIVETFMDKGISGAKGRNGRPGFDALHIEQMLAPTLSPGDIVVMDNLSSHKIDGVRQAIEDRSARLLYLPPYSPDFNPIEMAFAKLKALLRKAAERTVDALWDTIGQTLDTFTPQECVNYFKHAGYA